MNDRVKTVLNAVLDQFKSGDIPQVVAYSLLPTADIPSSRWSILNRTIMFLSGTHDGRGYRQWQEVGRFVKEGSKAFHILVPFIKKMETESGDGKQALLGFGCKAVFRVQDTDGKPLTYDIPEVHELPLIERAEQWGISIKAIPSRYSYFGYFSEKRGEIGLATKSEIVFFHEISHVAHSKIKGGLVKGQDPLQEIIAELSAQCLCRLVGKSGDRHLGNSYRYVERYAEELAMSPYNACLKVLNETEKVLKLILDGEEQERKQTIQ